MFFFSSPGDRESSVTNMLIFHFVSSTLLTFSTILHVRTPVVPTPAALCDAASCGKCSLRGDELSGKKHKLSSDAQRVPRRPSQHPAEEVEKNSRELQGY